MNSITITRFLLSLSFALTTSAMEDAEPVEKKARTIEFSGSEPMEIEPNRESQSENDSDDNSSNVAEYETDSVDDVSLSLRFEEIVAQAISRQFKKSPSFRKQGEEQTVAHEVHILKQIRERQESRMRNGPNVPELQGFSENALVLEFLEGVTPIKLGKFLKNKVDSGEMSEKERAQISFYGYMLVLTQLKELNKLDIYHMDNNGENFIFTGDDVYIIDFDCAEDVLAETVFHTGFVHQMTLKTKGLEARKKIYEREEQSSSLEVLGVLLNGEKEDTIGDTLSEGSRHLQRIEEPFSSAAQRLVAAVEEAVNPKAALEILESFIFFST